MPDGVVVIECPCCGAALEIDEETLTLLSYKQAERPTTPTDLKAAVKELKARESTRDERFRKQFESEKQHGAELEKRFQGLLKKTKSEGPVEPQLRDFDLD